jgi:hypothetical protein
MAVVRETDGGDVLVLELAVPRRYDPEWGFERDERKIRPFL